MTDLAHWQDDSDNALGGDFDSSLSGLCIMSLSFDLTKNSNHGTVVAKVPSSASNNTFISSYKDNRLGWTSRSAPSSCVNTPSALLVDDSPTTTTANSCVNQNHKASSSSHDMIRNSNTNDHNNTAHCFKKFKSSNSSSTTSTNDEDNVAEQHPTKTIAKVASISSGKNSINQSISISSTARESLSTRPSTRNKLNQNATPINRPEQESNADGSSPRSNIDNDALSESSISNHDDEDDDESSRSSPADIRTITPSSISTSSCTSTRSNTPNSDIDLEPRPRLSKKNKVKSKTGASNQLDNDNHTGTINSNAVKDSALANVISSSAPMHFKSLYHPFSIKQFPLSPYHQFSNSSFNHDYYDKYHSHDSHQPLQTPLIGFERTQDLLSLKLPPHGPEEFEHTNHSKFPKEWAFEDSKCNKNNSNIIDKLKTSSTFDNNAHQNTNNVNNNTSNTNNQNQNTSFNPANNSGQTNMNGNDVLPINTRLAIKDNRPLNRPSPAISPKGFPFNYKSNNSSSERRQESLDLNDHYEERNDDCYRQDNSQDKRDNIFNQCMRHFNPDDQNDNSPHSQCSIQHHCQESLFGSDSSKLKFQYVLSAPISVATKTNEDTITYLNQAQAYEIKLENISDLPETKKGFMCSIINIGFHERHMQQIENELWHQWTQQHPDEKIFTVDMKLSYNVFGVESDGLNKYEFLWDSSKAAGVFIRINSISTEFTPKKHGGEKGVPFKLSIETFSYNSKTHDSYFVSAAYCQVKVFKPKGAERKFRSDREKISKKQLSEQEKHHKSCDQTSFKECTINSLHPFAESANYYRHSHGHFASKQGIAVNMTATAVNNSTVGSSQLMSISQTGDDDNLDQQCQLSNHQLDNNNSNQPDHSPRTGPMSSSDPVNVLDRHRGNDSIDSRGSEHNRHDQRDYNHPTKFQNSINPDYMVERLSQSSNPQCRVNLNSNDNQDNYYSGSQPMGSSSSTSSVGCNISTSDNHNLNGSSMTSNNNVTTENNPNNGELANSRLNSQSNLYQQHHHPNPVRGTNFPNINNHQASFGMAYYGHALPSTIASHIAQPTHYGSATNSGIALNHSNQNLSSLHPQYSLNNRQSVGTTQTRPMIFNHEKKNYGPPSTPSSSSCSSSTMAQNAFKPSSLPNHGFPPYLNTAINHDLPSNPTNSTSMCSLNPSLSDASIVQGPNYSSDNYESPAGPPCHQAYHSNPLHAQQQTIRQQRSTTTLTTITSQGSSFLSHGPNHHQIEATIKPNSSTLFENNSNYWVHGANHNPSHLGNISSCSANQKNVASNPDNPQNPSVASQHQTPYDFATNLYDVDHNQSMQKGSSLSLNDLNYPRSKPNQVNLDDYGQSELFRHTIHITADSNCVEVMAWLRAHRFSPFIKTFNNFSGSDLLRLSKTELIEICGLSDGIRLNNCLHNQPIKPRKTLYICQHNNEIFHPIYLYNVNLDELLKELSIIVDSQSIAKSQQTRLLSKSGPLRKGDFQDNDNKFNSTTSSTGSRSPDEPESIPDHMYRTCPSESISRLLIDGLTSVRIVATEQVVQMLDDESVWNISVNNKIDSIDVCMSSCKSRKYKKQ